MSIHIYNPDIDGKLNIEPAPKINNTPTTTTTKTQPTIILLNDFTQPPVDNRPQYLKDRDIREARESVDFNKSETKRIINTIQERDNEERFAKNPVKYMGSKIVSGIIKKL